MLGPARPDFDKGMDSSPVHVEIAMNSEKLGDLAIRAPP
jgi:hypothetical protein